MANEVDISERWLLEVCPKALDALLKDHTTGANIYWATNSYVEQHGEGFGFFDQITVDKIKDDDIIKPRVRKDADEQSRRVKDKAEVFTPAWICNAQNNLVDDAWFGVANVFNTPIEEDGGKTWKSELNFPANFGKVHKSNPKSWVRYVNDPRLEITCGEAPYLMSRYDAVSGEEIKPSRRIGMFDRKMQVINAFENEPSKWMRRVKDAIKATYGFEWQGDSLLLAREAMLLTIFDYFFEKFPEERPEAGSKYPVNGIVVNHQQFSKFINQCAYFISWNLWQMDGLKFVLPGTSNLTFDWEKNKTNLFCTPETIKESAEEIMSALRNGEPSPDPMGIPAVISYWNYKQDKNGKDNAEPIDEAEEDSENKQDDMKRKIFFASLVT